ncbi:unnamed protein product, partial [marine sediment metagenome]
NQAVGRLLKGTVQRQDEPDKENNTGLPDNLKVGVENLSGMAMVKGQATEGTLQRVKDPQARGAFLELYPNAADLVADIDVNGTPTAILDALVNKYLNSGFVYDMAATTPQDFLGGNRRGDCSTLAKSFVIIAQEYFDIQGISHTSKSNFGIANGGLVLDANGATGNVDDGNHWAFTSHTWVVGPDRDRDLLFRGATVNPGSWIDQADEGVEEGIEYRSFGGIGGGRVYPYRQMGSTLANKYTTDLQLAKGGKAEDEAAMEEAFKLTESRRAKKKKGCFITTACIKAKGLPDNCEELGVLRAFRDTYLMQKPGGRQLVEMYYQYSPRIADVIAEQENAASVYDHLYEVIHACVEAIKKGDNKFAYTTYCEMVIKLEEQYISDVAAPSYVL